GGGGGGTGGSLIGWEAIARGGPARGTLRRRTVRGMRPAQHFLQLPPRTGDINFSPGSISFSPGPQVHESDRFDGRAKLLPHYPRLQHAARPTSTLARVERQHVP